MMMEILKGKDVKYSRSELLHVDRLYVYAIGTPSSSEDKVRSESETYLSVPRPDQAWLCRVYTWNS